MTCREFELSFQELLDGHATEAQARALEQALEAHAVGCAGCRKRQARFRVLRQALQAMPPAPAPSAGFVDRVLAASREPQALPMRGAFRPLVRLAAAAAVLAAGLATIHLAWNRTAPGPAVLVQAPSQAERPLTVALAEATSATWDLARAASAPAARVGSGMLGSAEVTIAEETPALPEAIVPAPEVLKEVSDRITASVRPLSGSARHAFGFLIDPAVGGSDPKPPAPPGPRDGA